MCSSLKKIFFQLCAFSLREGGAAFLARRRAKVSEEVNTFFSDAFLLFPSRTETSRSLLQQHHAAQHKHAETMIVERTKTIENVFILH